MQLHSIEIQFCVPVYGSKKRTKRYTFLLPLFFVLKGYLLFIRNSDWTSIHILLNWNIFFSCLLVLAIEWYIHFRCTIFSIQAVFWMDTCNSIEIRHYYYRESIMEYIIGYWKLRARRFTTIGGSHLKALPKYCRQKQGKCVGMKNQKERWRRRRLLPWTIPLHPFMSSDTPRVSWYTAVPMIFNVKWKPSIRKPHFSASQ